MKHKKNTRLCAACRCHDDKTALIRVVKTPDGAIVLDKSGKMNGRGVWLHNSPDCIEKAIKKRVLNFAFKCAVENSVYESLKSEQTRQDEGKENE
jgi:predicted RNA-binding protein YlxR (DUF448 family)